MPIALIRSAAIFAILELICGMLMRPLSLCFVFVVWAFLSSCSSSPSLDQSLGITPEQIRSSTDAEHLKGLQKTLAARLAEEEQEDFPQEFSLLEDLNRRIIELETKQLEKQLKEKQLITDGKLNTRVPLPELARLKSSLENDKDLSAGLLPEILRPIVREQTESAAVIRSLEAEANQQDLTAERRATVYHHLFLLSGEEKWQEIRDKQMDVIIKAIQEAADKNIFSSDMEKKIGFVRSIYVDQPKKIVEDMYTLYANMYAYRHMQARQQGDRKSAYDVLQNLTQNPDYPEIKTKLRPHAEKIAAEYASDVAERIERGTGLAETYRQYKREIEVRNILGLSPKQHPDTDKLIQQLASRFHSISKSDPYSALGLLLAQQTLDPRTADLQSSLKQQLEQVENTTIKSISISPFRSRYDDLNYGEVITPLISEHLHDALDGNIQVMEPGTDVDVDALITGNILEVKVESSQTRNKKQMLVDVGEVQRTNPAYIAWLELPSKERKNVAKPDETIREQKQQNVFITSTLHRKTGVFAVSYRLTDRKNNRVIFPDSITLQAEHEDESNEGLEVGELVIPYKIAKLPSDTEILQNLSQTVASAIAGNLAGVLLNQEIEYLKAADKSAIQNNCAEEVEHLAKAVALLANKSREAKDTEAPRKRLVERTLSCL